MRPNVYWLFHQRNIVPERYVTFHTFSPLYMNIRRKDINNKMFISLFYTFYDGNIADKIIM